MGFPYNREKDRVPIYPRTPATCPLTVLDARKDPRRINTAAGIKFRGLVQGYHLSADSGLPPHYWKKRIQNGYLDARNDL